jgi:hypothetical protein
MIDPSTETKARLTGAWRLQTIAHADGAPPVPAQGMIIYSASGHMSAQILSPGPNGGGEIEFHSYFGTYTIDAEASAVTHHREANNHVGAPADVVRRYRFVGEDVLVLRPDGHEGVVLTFRRTVS